MSAWIDVTEGATAGDRRPLSPGQPLLIGRHGDAGLRMDPEADVAVSARHALVVPSSRGWSIRDLDSRNGTWVNGERVAGERLLADGDTIRLGPGGPRLTFRTGEGTPATLVAPVTGSYRGTGRWTRNAASFVAVIVAVSALMYVAGGRVTRNAWERERAELESRLDSVLGVARSRAEVAQNLEGTVEGLVDALRRSEEEVESLKGALASATARDAGSDEVDDLRHRLQAVTVALERQQLAASLDFQRIDSLTRPGTAQIYVENSDGTVFTATGFGVSPTGLVMTNRHVVRGPDGRSIPRRIGVQFADSRQVWPARVSRVSESSDLALLRLDRITGSIPTAAGFNERLDTVRSGVPVALIGFPLGGGQEDGASGVVRPLVTAGVIRGRWQGLLEIQGYGREGASGSPVLDADGRVVGVLVGGREADGERILLAVPSPEAVRFLGRDGPGGGRSPG